MSNINFCFNPRTGECGWKSYTAAELAAIKFHPDTERMEKLKEKEKRERALEYLSNLWKEKEEEEEKKRIEEEEKKKREEAEKNLNNNIKFIDAWFRCGTNGDGIKPLFPQVEKDKNYLYYGEYGGFSGENLYSRDLHMRIDEVLLKKKEIMDDIEKISSNNKKNNNNNNKKNNNNNKKERKKKKKRIIKSKKIFNKLKKRAELEEEIKNLKKIRRNFFIFLRNEEENKTINLNKNNLII